MFPPYDPTSPGLLPQAQQGRSCFIQLGAARHSTNAPRWLVSNLVRCPVHSAGEIMIGLYSLFALLCVIIDRIFINPFRRRSQRG